MTSPTDPAPKPEAKPVSAADRIDEIIRDWVADHIFDTPVSRNTEAYNHLVSVLPHLKAKLAKEG